ncbi:MAG: hypothetical protein KF887_01260 [Paracoccaceae bacterium]|nr:MAG: hypothetical protein KF887_01260 [Paracoccaceae bacterium]
MSVARYAEASRADVRVIRKPGDQPAPLQGLGTAVAVVASIAMARPTCDVEGLAWRTSVARPEN